MGILWNFVHYKINNSKNNEKQPKYYILFLKETIPNIDTFDRNNVDDIINFILKTNANNCKAQRRKFGKEALHLKGDISWGADVQFKNEALMASRLANFISAYLQVSTIRRTF